MSLMLEDPTQWIVESKTINNINEPPDNKLPALVYDLQEVININASANDPDGNNADLRWSLSRSHSGRMSVPTGNMTQSGGSFSTSFYVKNRQGRDNSVYMGLKVTDPLNNSDQRSSSTSVRRDPLIFDLNMDGKVELQGGRSATPNTLQLPPGLWDINVLSTSKQITRFFVANANQGT